MSLSLVDVGSPTESVKESQGVWIKVNIVESVRKVYKSLLMM